MKNLIRVVVFGSRHLKDQKMFNVELDLYTYDFAKIEIVEGGQVSKDHAGRKWGADYFASEYASQKITERDSGIIMHTSFPANWGLYGNKAGPLRNEVMAEYSAYGFGLAFWDGRIEGCGTYDMIKRCEEHSINLKIIRI